MSAPPSAPIILGSGDSPSRHQHAGPIIVRGSPGPHERNPHAPIIVGGGENYGFRDPRATSETSETHRSEDLEGNDDDDGPEEEAQDLIAPNADVFSYFLLTAPSEHRKHNRFTVDAFTSYLLVFMVLLIQCTLLWCVWNRVIGENVDWRKGIMNTGKDWNIVGPMNSGSSCNDGSSLCYWRNGTFTCAPPSVQLISEWDELDTNKDGVWTRDEVIFSREALKCKYAVDPLEVFDMLGALLQNRESKKYIWIHPDIKTGKQISRDYFTYIKGDVAMCGYRNGDMCGNLVKRGFFDAALMTGKIPRIGKDLRSALKYCHELLDNGGICERYMPSAYSTWKIESVQECRGPDYKKFVYEDPSTGRTRSLLSVDYGARQSYEVAQSTIFKVYKTFIMFIWLLLICAQLREVCRTFSWINQVAIAKDGYKEAETPSARERRLGKMDSARRRSAIKDEAITQITRSHKSALLIVTWLRISIIIVLLYVGLNFLARQNDYIGLLLDGVAMIFIVQVEEILYSTVVRRDVRQIWEERTPMPFRNLGVLSGRPDISDLVWFFLLLLFATAFMTYYTKWLVEPLYDAIKCTCLSEGSTCHEAHAFSYEFWQQYWMLDLPSAIMRINRVQHGYGASAAALVQSAGDSHAGRLAGAVGSLLSRHVSLTPR